MKDYKTPKGYISWNELKEKFRKVEIVNSIKEIKYDFSVLYSQQTFCLENNYPVYCLRSSLMQEFEETDVGENIGLFLDISLPGFLILFPSKKVPSYASEDGFIEYCFFTISEVMHPDYKYQMSWTCIDSQDNVVCSIKNIRKDGTIKLGCAPSDVKPWQIERSFYLRNIILQSVLMIEYQSSEISLVNFSKKEKGFAVSKPEPHQSKFRIPRWIGESSTSKSKKPEQQQIKPGTAKRHHWRRGHWRKIREGTYTRVRPCVIN